MTDINSLVERLRMAQIASCTCMTKSPDTEYHAEDCRYRVLDEAANAIEQLAKDAERFRWASASIQNAVRFFDLVAEHDRMSREGFLIDIDAAASEPKKTGE